MLSTSNTVKQFLQLHPGRIDHEVFAVTLLRAQQQFIEMEVLFRGTLIQTAAHPREAVKRAMGATRQPWC